MNGNSSPGLNRRRPSPGLITGVLLEVREELLAEMASRGFYHRGVVRFDPVPWDINNGSCEEFGERALARLRQTGDFKGSDLWCDWVDAILAEDDGVADPVGVPIHYVLYAAGRWYDAECVEGVTEVGRLPIFARSARPSPAQPGAVTDAETDIRQSAVGQARENMPHSSGRG